MAKLAGVAFESYDYESLNNYCVDASRDPDVLVTFITDPQGNPVTTFANSEEPILQSLMGEKQVFDLKEVINSSESFKDVIKVVAEAKNRDGETLGRVVVLAHTNSVKEQIDTIINDFQKVESTLEKEFTESNSQLENLLDKNMRQGLVTGVLVGVVCAALSLVLLGVMIAKAVVRPLKTGVSFAESVAQGDLDATISMARRDEIGVLAESLRKMADNLKNRIAIAETKSSEAAEEAEKAKEAVMLAEEAKKEAEKARQEGMLQAADKLDDVVKRVTLVSEQLNTHLDRAAKGSKTQKERSGETATAMEEMNATVLEVAKNASHAAEGSDQARTKAQDGAKVVRQVVEAVQAVQSQGKALKENMTSLGDQTQSIGQILEVINDIADQTNLLALNAAIEAARAGEAGRGFAVVADEVRKLAEKTMSATNQVGETIKGIQTGAKASMESVDQSVSAVDRATKLAGESGEALQEIVKLVDDSSDQIRTIATASEEQATTSEHINSVVEEINNISIQTAEIMLESAQSVSELNTQSQTLKTLIEELKSV